jgi:hypothetical protein
MLWRMPIGPAYDKLIDSPIADMKNVGPRFGGSITAAQFLARFIDKGVAWAHLDIAGTVWIDKPGATHDKGATGFGVRLLDRYVRDVLEADAMPKMRRKSDLPSKTCRSSLPFTWRKKWERDWDNVKYCSDRCRRGSGPV